MREVGFILCGVIAGFAIGGALFDSRSSEFCGPAITVNDAGRNQMSGEPQAWLVIRDARNIDHAVKKVGVFKVGMQVCSN